MLYDSCHQVSTKCLNWQIRRTSTPPLAPVKFEIRLVNPANTCPVPPVISLFFIGAVSKSSKLTSQASASGKKCIKMSTESPKLSQLPSSAVC
jgi:hypothetical protein